jgi:hypothetical protein
MHLVFSVFVAIVLILSSIQLEVPTDDANDSLISNFPILRIGTVEAAGTVDYTVDGTDDNVQFQAALDALPATGGRIQALSGTYNFSATVSRAIDNVLIEGTGQATIFNNDAATALFSAGSQANWTFRDFSTDAGGLTVSSATYWTMQDITIGASYYAFRTSEDVTASSWDIPSGRSSTCVIAASGSPNIWKAQADYICDGTEDTGGDEVEIQAAIDSLGAFGGIIQFAPGYYFTSNTITISKNYVWMRGTGSRGGGSTIYLVDGSNCNMIDLHGVKQRFTYLELDGNDAGQTESNIHGIYHPYEGIGADVSLDTVYFWHIKGSGIYTENPYLVCTNCATEYCDVGYTVTGVNAKDAHFTGGTFYNNDVNAIFQDSGHHVIDGVSIYSGSPSIRFVNSDCNTVLGCNFVGNGYISIEDSDSICITGNSFDNSGNYALMIDTGCYNNFSSNNVSGTTIHGIIIKDGSLYNHIDGNTLLDLGQGANNTNYGIFIQNSGTVSQNNYITDNKILSIGANKLKYGVCLDTNQTNNYIERNTIVGAATANVIAVTAGNHFDGNIGYIAPGEIRTYSGTIATLTQNAYNSLDNPFGQAVRVLSMDVYVSTAATSTSPNIDCGIGNSATTDYATLFDDLPGETIGFYRSTIATPGTQTVPVLWESGSGNRYLNMSIKDAVATGMVSTYTITVMGN